MIEGTNLNCPNGEELATTGWTRKGKTSTACHLARITLLPNSGVEVFDPDLRGAAGAIAGAAKTYAYINEVGAGLLVGGAASTVSQSNLCR